MCVIYCNKIKRINFQNCDRPSSDHYPLNYECGNSYESVMYLRDKCYNGLAVNYRTQVYTIGLSSARLTNHGL